MNPPTFAGHWNRAVADVGQRDFLVFCDVDGVTTSFTYAAMDALVAEVAGALVAAGVQHGSAVHLVLGNSPAFVATWLACSRIGAWMVPADPGAAVDELARQIERVRPAAAVCGAARASDYRSAVDVSDRPVPSFSVDEADTALDGLRGGVVPAEPVGPTTRLSVMFTSGTTSEPKGVEVTQANYAFTGEVMAAASGLSGHDRQLVVLPLFHANAQYYSIASAIAVGASVALVQRFSASQFVDQARHLGATHASLFAAPIRMILARTPPGTEPLALHHAWFAQNLSSAQFEAITTLLGCRPRQLYGMTETVPAVLSNPAIGSRETSIGRPTLGCHVRLGSMHDDGPAGPGEVGKIEVGGYPGTTLFAGYLDDATATDAAIVERSDDGFVWFATGDRATVDDAGFYSFQGRSAEVLKIGGENVSLAEIEHVIGEHPAVHEVAAVGVHDPVLDEVPHAFVVLAPGAIVTAGDLHAFAETRLAKFKRPRTFEFVAELPRTSVGKIRKFLLKPSPAEGDRPSGNEVPGT